MRSKLTLFFIIMLVGHLAMAQTHEVMGEVVYGTFSMTELKRLQKEMVKSQTVPYRVVTTFPAYFGYNLSLSFSIGQRWSLGPRFQYISTGGRLYYGDYSGYIFQDQLLTGYGIAIQSKYRLSQPQAALPTYFTFSGGAMITKLNFVSEAALTNGPVSRDELDISSLNYVIAPGLQVKKRVFVDRLSVAFSLGYEFQIHGKLKSGDGYLVNSKGAVRAEWDGIRLGAGVAYIINKD